MDVQRIMTPKVVTVELDDTLETVKEALSPNLGTSTESCKDRATLNKRVHQVMSRDPISLTPQSSILDAVKIFNEHRISCIPIVDAEDRPVGILSRRDILRSLIENRAEVAELLQSQVTASP
jgi:acetoin utilization protein AcuB